MKLIEVTNADKYINKKCVLREVKLSITKGHAYRLCGDNGCRKTTLLQCILGIVNVDKGDIKAVSDKDGLLLSMAISFVIFWCIFPYVVA